MKTYKQFNQELNEVAGAIRAVRGLSRVMRAGPTFKAVKNVGSTTRMFHGTTSDVAKKVATQGFKSATGKYAFDGGKKMASYYKKFKPYREPNRAYVTSDRGGAEAYARMRANAKNKEFLRKIGIRKKVEPVVQDVTVPKGDLRQAVNKTEFTVATKNIQPNKVNKVKDPFSNEKRKQGREFIKRTRKDGDLHTA
tara:strand:+ start:54 stop:638 length:585 start_codon:yes stop_codon:yes gene_type:complete